MIFALELLVGLVPVGLGVLGRILYGRPWTVEAGSNRGREVEGERLAGQRRRHDSVAERLRATGQIGDVTWRP